MTRPLGLRFVRAAILVAIAVVLGGAVSGVLAIRALTRPQHAALRMAVRRYHVRLGAAGGTRIEEVSIDRAGAQLIGTVARPGANDRHEAVLLAHGLGDDRTGLADMAGMLLDAGYTVLAVDERGHGQSTGNAVTFGTLESDDLIAWLAWLYAHDHPACMHGYGLSMGASSLLLAAGKGAPLCSVWSDSAYASFAELSRSQSAVAMGVGPWFASTLGRVSVLFGFAYARLALGVNLNQAAPIGMLGSARVPIMLVHGEADRMVPIAQLDELAQVDPAAGTWRVPRAGHVQARDVAGREYDTRLLAWLTRHGAKQGTAPMDRE